MEQDYEDCLATEHRQNSSFQCLGNFLTCAHQAPNYTVLSYFPLSFSSCTGRRELVLLQWGRFGVSPGQLGSVPGVEEPWKSWYHRDSSEAEALLRPFCNTDLHLAHTVNSVSVQVSS